jgi:hypothetical protein
MTDKSYAAYHTGGEDPCQKLAFTFIDHPASVDRVTHTMAVMPDGGHPDPARSMYCGSCKNGIGGFEYSADRKLRRTLSMEQCLTLIEVDKIGGPLNG